MFKQCGEKSADVFQCSTKSVLLCGVHKISDDIYKPLVPLGMLRKAQNEVLNEATLRPSHRAQEK